MCKPQSNKVIIRRKQKLALKSFFNLLKNKTNKYIIIHKMGEIQEKNKDKDLDSENFSCIFTLKKNTAVTLKLRSASLNLAQLLTQSELPRPIPWNRPRMYIKDLLL